MQRQRIETGRRGRPDGEQTDAVARGEARTCGRGDSRDRHVEQRIGIGAQMQARVDEIPAFILESDRLVALEQSHDDAEAVFEQPPVSACLMPIIAPSVGSEPGPTPSMTRPRVRWSSRTMRSATQRGL